MFDDERAMVRLDMSEYMEKHTVSRLIGLPLDMWDTRRVVSSLKRFGVVPTRSFSSTRSRRPTRTCSTSSSSFSTTDADRWPGQNRRFHESALVMTSNLGSEFIEPELPMKSSKNG